MSVTDERAACLLVPETTYGTNETASPVRVCVIDLGTNSFHAVIVDAHPNGSFQVVDRLKEMVRLGQHGLEANTLPEEAMKRGLRALKRIHLLAKGWDAHEFLAFATSAIREASNGGVFIRRVRQELGLHVRPISGEQEANLIYQGVRRAVGMPAPTLLIDVGGGSVEFIVVARGESVFSRSLKLGAARMTERFVSTDPLSEADQAALRSHFEETLGTVFDACRAHGVRAIVGSSGTMKALARVALESWTGGGDTVFHRTFAVDTIRDALGWVLDSTADERLAHPAIDPKRVDQIGAGAVLLDTVLNRLPDVRHLKVSPNALREGMVVHFMDTNYHRIQQMAPFRDPRRRSVHEMAYRFQWEERHAQHVAATATFLFDVCRSLYEGPARDAELLEYAALLHDVGYLLSHGTHERHSRYLIQNADLQGFRSEERLVMSLAALYHRGRRPDSTDEQYGRLSSEQQCRVRQLASLLRIAEGLDRSHFQNVVALRAQLSNRKLNLHVATKEDPQLEVWAAEDRGVMFEEEYGRSLSVEPTTIQADTEYPDPPVSYVTSTSVS
jgi:exopolyphosphatase/guanosine-5'-triphosphate,3'-diphosphate pyrophosphatase